MAYTVESLEVTLESISFALDVIIGDAHDNLKEALTNTFDYSEASIQAARLVDACKLRDLVGNMAA